MDVPGDVGHYRRRSVILATTIVYYSSQWFLAAFNYDYNALDGGERSAIANGYEDIL